MRGIPLWPAGHLPLRGEDWLSRRLSPISNAASVSEAPELPISPLEGEMPGRAEGGASRPLMRLEGASRPLTPLPP
ncbi:MAG: lytic murein transglycosylase [Mesorhizobium sp.]|nr:MAG: lytic murein transglycosylase [Mesorhizobium sp.]